MSSSRESGEAVHFLVLLEHLVTERCEEKESGYLDIQVQQILLLRVKNELTCLHKPLAPAVASHSCLATLWDDMHGASKFN